LVSPLPKGKGGEKRMLPLRLLSEGEKLLDPIPLLNPPPSQREGGGNYCMYFLPLLWRGRTKEGEEKGIDGGLLSAQS